ncbi:MAG: HEAT repeat domain-containing protein [Planctomycetia bacterium]|nr:HEAT repeat domain-containing protein [Planctomycetia bacterium]
MATDRQRLPLYPRGAVWIFLLGSCLGCHGQVADSEEPPERRQQIAEAALQVQSRSPTERVKGATALGNLLEDRRSFDSITIGALGRAVDDPDQSVRLSAIAAIGQIGKPLLVSPLQHALRSTDPKTVQAANDAFEAIREKNQPAIDSFVKKLHSTNRDERARAAGQLSLFGPAAKGASAELVPFAQRCVRRGGRQRPAGPGHDRPAGCSLRLARGKKADGKCTALGGGTRS